MASTEQVHVWFGTVGRLIGTADSNVLALLPMGIRPDPEPACASCPANDWYLTVKGLRCYCTARGVISWVSNDDPVMACAARDRLIENAEMRARGDGAG